MLLRMTDRQNRIVPVTMERLGAKRERVHGLPAHRDADGIGLGVEARAHPKARTRRRGGNELHNDFVGNQRLTPPVLADEGEEAANRNFKRRFWWVRSVLVDLWGCQTRGSLVSNRGVSGPFIGLRR